MNKNFISAAILIAASTFTAQAIATTTIDLQDYSGTLIDNKWQDFSPIFGPGFEKVHSSTPYTINTSDNKGTLTLSPIVNFGDNSHIHVNGGDGNPSTPTTPFIHGDVDGVFIDGSGSHERFSLQSMDVLNAVLQSDGVSHPNATVTVRGFLGGINNMMTGTTEADGVTMLYAGGNKVAETTIANDFTGPVNFLALDANFSEVDYVEFFFTDFYRIKAAPLGDTVLEFDFDNIVVGDVISTPPPATVPVPAAVWLFGTGLIGLTSLNNRKKQV